MSGSSSYRPGKVTGSCACRSITFETTVLGSQQTSSCYCRECAKVSGGGFLPFINFPAASLKWSKQPDVWKSSDFAERGFCKECGSSVFFRDNIDPDVYGIVLSMIDHSSEPVSTPQQHIFLAEKAEWVIVPDDGSGKYEKHEPGFQKRFDEWKRSNK